MKEHPSTLIEKYMDGKATPEERRFVESHYNQLLSGSDGLADQETIDRASRLIRGDVGTRTGVDLGGRHNRRLIPAWMRYAAMLLLSLSIGVAVYWYADRTDPAPTLTSMYGEDVLPGGNRATLTLADGHALALSDQKTGIVIGTDALTYDDGTALPIPSPTDLEAAAQLTLRTPNGGQYQVTLPDGSKVWLNAGSSLSYPTRFTGGERLVELTGEAFFEVARDERQPFIVASGEQRIRVLGTQFNVNAYTNEPVLTTTLVEGSVLVHHTPSGQSITIYPGQQTILNGQQLSVHSVDISAYIAWKNGYFQFEGTELKNILRQLERWYDIDVDYTDMPDRKLHAKINRDRNISAVLNAIEKTSGIRFNIEERRLSLSE